MRVGPLATTRKWPVHPWAIKATQENSGAETVRNRGDRCHLEPGLGAGQHFSRIQAPVMPVWGSPVSEGLSH